jgi:hypothetical protein
MGDLPDEMRSAHDQGRADTGEVLRSGVMSDEYAHKLTKGSFGLTFWLAAATCCWLVLGMHWPLWAVAVGFIPGWLISALVWAGIQTGAIMLIWRVRGVRRPNSN